MLQMVFFLLLQGSHKIWLVFHLFKPLTYKRFYSVHYKVIMKVNHGKLIGSELC